VRLTAHSTQVAITPRPARLDVRAEADASNLQNSSVIVRTRSARPFGSSRVEMSEVGASVSRMLEKYRDLIRRFVIGDISADEFETDYLAGVSGLRS